MFNYITLLKSIYNVILAMRLTKEKTHQLGEYHQYFVQTDKYTFL